MKNISSYSILIFFLIFYSCKKEENKTKQTNTVKTDTTKVFSSLNIALGNQSSDGYTCFMSFDSAKIYTLAEAKANQNTIDLIFLHNNPDNLAMFVSPSSLANATTIKPGIYDANPFGNLELGVYYWAQKNTIQIGVTDISAGDFNNIQTNGQLNTAYDNDYHVTIGWEIDIKPNKIYKFTSNRTGKKGLIKVNSINGDYSTAGLINFDIKIMK